MTEKDAGQKGKVNYKSFNSRIVIGIKRSTRDKLNNLRAPGQCYDGFIWQLLDLWEEVHGGNNHNGNHPL